MNSAKLMIILGVVAVGVYINTLANGFIWDDEDLIMEDKYIKSPKYIGYLFTPQYWKKDFVAHEGRFRPLRALTFVAEWQIWGKNPVGYHLTNLLLNLAAVFSVYYLAQILFNGESVKSFFSALLFAVHPVHTESVAWIKNRTDILMTIFYVLATALFIRYLKMKNLSLKNYFIVGGLFILSLLSKEAAITLSLVFAAYVLIGEKETFVDSVKKFLPFVLLSVVFLGFIIFGLLTSQLKSPIDIKANLLALTQYLRLLILPYDLNAERALVTGVDLIGPIFFVTIIYFIIRKKLYLEMFALVWLFITLLPALDIRFITSRPIAEQRLYLPSVGLGLLAGSQMSKKLWSRILLIAIVVGFSGITFARNFDWQDSVRFWEKTVRQSPASDRAFTNLGVAYEKSGRDKDALMAYLKSIEVNSENFVGYLNMGMLLYNKGNFLEAEKAFNKVIEKGDKQLALKGKLALGMVYLSKGDLSAAENIYKEILSFYPDSTESLNMLGVIYDMRKERRLARNCWQRVIELDPINSDALYNLAMSYHKEGELNKAMSVYKELLKHHPNHLDAMNNLGIICDVLGLENDAVDWFKRVLTLNPSYVQAAYNLGGIYMRNKKYIQALVEYTRVVEINPSHQDAKKKIEDLKHKIKDRNL